MASIILAPVPKSGCLHSEGLIQAADNLRRITGGLRLTQTTPKRLRGSRTTLYNLRKITWVSDNLIQPQKDYWGLGQPHTTLEILLGSRTISCRKINGVLDNLTEPQKDYWGLGQPQKDYWSLGQPHTTSERLLGSLTTPDNLKGITGEARNVPWFQLEMDLCCEIRKFRIVL